MTSRETVTIVEMEQPFCGNTYGSSPCTASGDAARKCFNTRATCQDPDNFALTTKSLFFSTGTVAERGVEGAPYIIPSLTRVTTNPSRINLSAADPDATGLGTRATLTVSFDDHPHSDRVVDPYRADRGYDPMTKGSFWTKWFVRNKYRFRMPIHIYEGYAGQSLSEMQRRSYLTTGSSWPSEGSGPTFQAKDWLSLLEERKAQAPEASPGVLVQDIGSGWSSVEVEGATADDYEAAGTLRINDELMTYTGITTGAESITFTGVTRGTDGTTASSHSEGDTAQRCVRYTDATVQEVLEDLLITWGGIEAERIDSDGIADEFDSYLLLYRLTTVISDPVSVATLLSELQTEVGFYIWWDERAALIKARAVHGVASEPPMITSEDHILAGSFSVVDQPRSRISQLWFYYDIRSPVGSLSDPVNFRTVQVQADLASEGDEQYGEASIKTIYSRWVNTGALALNTTSKIITRYANVPRTCTFRLDAKDRAYWVGDTVKISHFMEVDDFGDRRTARWTIISAEEVEPGHTIEYTAEDTELYGVVPGILEDGSPDHTTGASIYEAYIGDNDGLLSDGTNCARIA
ncbi:MAG: hypothetical protein ABNH26_08800 [Celeribacter sp.]|jgi:hypothetical protein